MMSRRTMLAISASAIVLQIGCTRVAVEPAERASDNAGAAPLLVIDRHFFGIPETAESPFTASASLRNEGAEVVVIERVLTSCDCTNARLSASTIPPGESASLAFSVELKPNEKTSATIHVLSNDLRNPRQLIEIEEDDPSAVQFSSAELNLGSLLEGSSVDVELQVESRRRVFSPADFFAQSTLEVAHDGGPALAARIDDRGRCRLTGSAGDSPGVFRPIVLLEHPSLRDPIVCHVQLEVVPPVRLSPPSIAFSPGELSRSVDLQPFQGTELVDVNILEGSEPTVCHSEVRSAGEDFEIVVTVRETPPEPFWSDNVRVAVTTREHGERVLELPVSGHRGDGRSE